MLGLEHQYVNEIQDLKDALEEDQELWVSLEDKNPLRSHIIK
jgi:hypothetical protein